VTRSPSNCRIQLVLDGGLGRGCSSNIVEEVVGLGRGHDSLERAYARGAMRGSNQRSGELFSYVALERRVRFYHPLRAIGADGFVYVVLSGDLRADSSWSSVERARDFGSGDAVACVLLGSLGASAVRRFGVSIFCSAVSSGRYGRSLCGALDLSQNRDRC